MLITAAFECITQKLFDEEGVIYELQNYDLTEEDRDNFITKIDDIVGKHKKSKGEDNATQIHITTEFPLFPDDFREPFFAEPQIIDLHDSIKLLTNPTGVNVMNNNAIVLEGTQKPSHSGAGHQENKEVRVYLMDKDKEVDIREFFTYIPTVEGNDYNLEPGYYTEGVLKKHFDNQKELLYYLNYMANELTKRSKKA